jgi:SAM-dependent methyltransferase
MSDPREPFADYLSRHYARLGDADRHRAGKQRQLALTYGSLLPADRAAPMLEIGPGFGQLLELLRRDLGYTAAVAVDVSEEVVAYCNHRMPGSTEHAADTAAFLARHPGRFQRVFALHVLEHLPPEAARTVARAVHGALAPGGRFVVEVPNQANAFTGGYLRYADPTHEHGYTEWSLHHLLETAGFTDVRCFEERIPRRGAKGLLANLFRAAARLTQRVLYKGYELPVPTVLTPSLCAVATRADAPR